MPTETTTAELWTWGGDPPAIVRVDGLYFSYGCPIEKLGTGADLSWPCAVVVNGIAYGREG